MYTSTILSSVLLPLLALATPIRPRAGGPAIVPIPSTCSVISPLTDASVYPPPSTTTSPSTTTTPSPHYSPAASLLANQIYAYYLAPSDAPGNFTQCLEQCYGFGERGTCKSAYMATGVPRPPMYGLPGGDESIACLMYGVEVKETDFVLVEEGFGDPRVGVIEC
ncbi:hypothetical protein M501DRAFT_460435 [Patellaria atrata CBS 101060]|uniref:Apple domain-containing protein n=1 Tax=Patellaria atrata CBS 101060 TaxID=1346257 RepID=A0A9P4S511_9PEZI|nr:hypothetical protein M501DRAFT_460435 [Patellaria atrata CBS 101060]